jgi:hypothetical protein
VPALWCFASLSVWGVCWLGYDCCQDRTAAVSAVSACCAVFSGTVLAGAADVLLIFLFVFGCGRWGLSYGCEFWYCNGFQYFNLS